MIEFVTSVFRGLFSIITGICMIGIVIFGVTIFDDSVLISLLVIVGGLIIVVFTAGFIATILNIDENLENISTKLSNLNNAYNQRSSATNTNNVHSLQSISAITKDNSHDEKKRCERCNNHVPVNVFSCPKCKGTDFV